jgi:hypothetical protein
MVKQVPDQPEETLITDFAALKALDSVEIQASQTARPYKIWCCGVNQMSDALGYWIGQLPDCYLAFIVVNPISLSGMSALEVIRAWVHPDWRMKGMHAELLNCAVTKQSSVLVGDRDGMTLAIFNAWNQMSGFQVRYFDSNNGEFVLEDHVPQQDKFTSWSDGDRWLITLTKNP